MALQFQAVWTAAEKKISSKYGSQTGQGREAGCSGTRTVQRCCCCTLQAAALLHSTLLTPERGLGQRSTLCCPKSSFNGSGQTHTLIHCCWGVTLAWLGLRRPRRSSAQLCAWRQQLQCCQLLGLGSQSCWQEPLSSNLQMRGALEGTCTAAVLG